MLRVPDSRTGFLVRPALLPRLAQAARGRFARLDSTLREIRFQGFTFTFSSADVPFAAEAWLTSTNFSAKSKAQTIPPHQFLNGGRSFLPKQRRV